MSLAIFVTILNSAIQCEKSYHDVQVYRHGLAPSKAVFTKSGSRSDLARRT